MLVNEFICRFGVPKQLQPGRPDRYLQAAACCVHVSKLPKRAQREVKEEATRAELQKGVHKDDAPTPTKVETLKVRSSKTYVTFFKFGKLARLHITPNRMG